MKETYDNWGMRKPYKRDAKLFRHRLVPILPVLYGVVNFKFMIIDLLHITLPRSCWFRVNLLNFRPRERERTQYTTIVLKRPDVNSTAVTITKKNITVFIKKFSIS